MHGRMDESHGNGGPLMDGGRFQWKKLRSLGLDTRILPGRARGRKEWTGPGSFGREVKRVSLEVMGDQPRL
jgi:hypothetical protein